MLSRRTRWEGAADPRQSDNARDTRRRFARLPFMARIPDMGRLPVEDFSLLREDDKPPVLCVHGMIGAKGNWEVLAPHITDRRVFCVDYGDAGTAPVDRSTDDLAAQIIDLSRRINARELILLGHSRGGIISLLAASRPDVQSVVTIRRVIGLGAHFSGIPRWRLLPAAASSQRPSEFFFSTMRRIAYWAVGASSTDQFTDSPTLVQALDQVDRSIEVISIASSTDYVVRPSSAFEVPTDHVHAVLMQDYFPGAKILHNLLPRDARAIAMVKAALARPFITREEEVR